MKKILFSTIIFALSWAQHFNVNIEETGVSTLFIFDEEISTLSYGDELGLFDLNGVIDDSGAEGEVLVGSGVWNGQQLNIVTIESQNLSQFGGPILPGAISGNNMFLKIHYYYFLY